METIWWQLVRIVPSVAFLVHNNKNEKKQILLNVTAGFLAIPRYQRGLENIRQLKQKLMITDIDNLHH